MLDLWGTCFRPCFMEPFVGSTVKNYHNDAPLSISWPCLMYYCNCKPKTETDDVMSLEKISFSLPADFT